MTTPETEILKLRFELKRVRNDLKLLRDAFNQVAAAAGVTVDIGSEHLSVAAIITKLPDIEGDTCDDSHLLP